METVAKTLWAKMLLDIVLMFVFWSESDVHFTRYTSIVCTGFCSFSSYPGVFEENALNSIVK